MERRTFMKAGLGLAGAAAIVPDAFGQAAEYEAAQARTSRRYQMRWLWVYNPHTRDHIIEIYYDGANYRPDSLYRLDVLMCDWRQNLAVQIDRGLYERMYWIQQVFTPKFPLFVTSGYRTPETNRMLSETTPGVARRSMHMWGRAADMQIYGYAPKPVAAVLNATRMGGVGAYAHHVHVDTGAPRFWSRV